MNTGFKLFQLQEIDTAIDKARKRILEIQSLIENDKTTQTAQAKVEKQEKLYIKVKNEFDELNDEVQTRKNKKSQSESSLYGGSISNPKELQDLQKEISYLTSTISEMEDQLLQKLIHLENVEEELSEDKANLKTINSDFETRKSLLLGEKNQLENTIDSQNEQRQSIVGQIDTQTLEIYRSMRESKSGYAVARLEDDACSACGTSLTASQRQQARSPGTLLYCPSCGRIIYGS
jgi:hypothetical protein